MVLMFLVVVANVVVGVVVVIVDVVVIVRLLPLLLIMMMISTILRFVFYMPLLVVGVMTYFYAFGPAFWSSTSLASAAFNCLESVTM
jgi:hypothetical protein